VIGRAELGPDAPGHTYVVDASGGGDFLDLPPAIAASQAGDVLLMVPGAYSKFTLSKGLTIVGSPGVHVGAVTIANVPAEDTAVLVGLYNLKPVSIASCPGRVVLQEHTGAYQLTIDQCSDVRLRDVDLRHLMHGGYDALLASASRIELAGSLVEGSYLDVAPGVAGTALVAENGSRVHVVDSTIWGAFGGIVSNTNFKAPDGGFGVFVDATSEVLAIGPLTRVFGGNGGWNMDFDNCDYDGEGAFAVAGFGVFAHSTVELLGGWTPGFGCTSGGQAASFEPTVIHVASSPLDPELLLVGKPVPGATVQVEVLGEPGASVVVWLGRQLVLGPGSTLTVEQLVSHGFMLPPATLDPNGRAAWSITLDPSLHPGLVFAMQAEVTAASVLQRTNSVPVVVR
ncbi:MAG: hypothetical protein IT453_18970, partial [Planctomycetes bacterium]|nr:hypothetical protein [Planctomycetota bacterium]